MREEQDQSASDQVGGQDSGGNAVARRDAKGLAEEVLRIRGYRSAFQEPVDVARHPGGVVACISHGGLINAVVGSWLGVVDDMWFVPWHTGISAVLLRADRRILLTVNDAAHLGGDQDMLGLVAGHVRG